MGVRRQAREAALQAVFMCDFLSLWSVETSETCLDHFGVIKNVRPFALQLCQGVVENLAKVDSSLTCASEHWSLNRMGRVDRSILRIATYELMFLPDVPVNVSINEAIEIAKRYGSEESPQFVNGVLDRVASMVRPRVAVDALQVEVIREPESASDANVIGATLAELEEELLSES